MKSGVIFVANSDGVLVYNGRKWKMVKGSEDLQLFKFGVDAGEVIYTGGKKELGMIVPDSSGRYVYRSLTHQISTGKLERISRVLHSKGKTYFLDNHALFIWDGQKMETIETEGTFHRIFEVPEGILVTDAKELYILEGGTLKLFSSVPNFNSLNIRGVFADEETQGKIFRYLIVTAKSGLYYLTSTGLEKIPSELDSAKIYNACPIGGNRFAVSTDGNGVYIIHFDGRVEDVIDNESGLQQSQVLMPREGGNGELWASLFRGVSRIEYDSPLSYFDNKNGLNALSFQVKNTFGEVFIGATTGLYHIVKENNPHHKVQSINPSGPMLDTRKIYPLHGGIMAGYSDGINFISKSGISKVVLEKLLTIIHRSEVDTNKIYYITRSQRIGYITYNNGQWKDKGEFADILHQVYHFAETPSGDLWVTHNGITFIDFDSSGDMSPQVLALDSTHGYDKSAMGNVQVTKLGDRIVFGTQMGIYKWDEPAKKLIPDNTYGEDFANGKRSAYNLTQTRAGDVWVTTNHNTGILRLQPDGTYVYDSLPIIRAPISDVFSIYEDPEGVMWFGGTEALVRYDPRIQKDYHQKYYTLISRVMVNGKKNVVFHGSYAGENGAPVFKQPESYVLTFPYSQNNLIFEFAAPFFEAPEKLRYSYQLVGQDETWSEWTDKGDLFPKKEYTNLREGEYTFRVKAINVYGTISEIAEYKFRILPPWYRTTWGYILWAALAAGTLFITARLYSRRLIRQKHRLEKTVTSRTAEIQRQKEEIQHEMQVSETLLLNILPKETAAELKAKGSVAARRYDNVTVMFADIKDFTLLAEKSGPEELVRDLHECFSAFDELMAKFNLEKIKTIGDAYMCAGGLPVQSADDAVRVVKAALAMQQVMKEVNARKEAQGKPRIAVRIGIHSGPVVSGIVGKQKFQFDIWGDTVNTASRLESTGEVGKVNISGTTWEMVKDHFRCTFRGMIEAKNKGQIAMYFVESEL